MSEKKKAIVYCRVSTTKQSEEGTSLDTQAEACQLKAKELGYVIEKTIKEVYSGADLFERPKLNAVRSDIRAGKVDALIIYAIDRLSRNIAHLAIIDEECHRAKCELLFVQDDIDNSAEGKLLLSVRGYVAEVERLKIRERSMRGRRAKLLNGIPVITGKILYGYSVDKESNKYLINESEAAVVRQIYDLALQGYGCATIARKLNEQNIPTQNNSFWQIGQVHRVLTHEAYTGIEYANRNVLTDTGKRTKRNRSEWIRLPSETRPPIITLLQFEKVAQQRKKRPGDAVRNWKNPILLRGLVYCDICGSKMYPNIRYEKYNNYIRFRCGSRKTSTQTVCPNSLPFESILNKFIKDYLKKFLLDPNSAETYCQKYIANQQADDIESEIQTTKKLLKKTANGLERLLTTFRNVEEAALARAVEREIYQASQEKESLEKVLAVLKERQLKSGVQNIDFEAFKDAVENLRNNFDTMNLEELREHLIIFSLKIFVNRKKFRIEINPFTV